MPNIYHLQWSYLISLLPITRVSQLAIILMKVFVELFVNCLGLKRLWTEQTTLSCTSCLMPGSEKYEGLPWNGLGLFGKKYYIVICYIASCKSCRKTKFLSFIVLPARNLITRRGHSGSFSSKPLQLPFREQNSFFQKANFRPLIFLKSQFSPPSPPLRRRRGEGTPRRARAQRHPRLLWDTSRRKDEHEIRSKIQRRSFLDWACFFAALRCARRSSERLLPPPARGYSVRQPGEEVDERRWTGLRRTLHNTFRFSLASRRPTLFNPSSPNTESLNQRPAVFSTRLIYRRKSERSAKPPGAGAHLPSGNPGTIVCTVLLSDWTKPTIDTEI